MSNLNNKFSIANTPLADALYCIHQYPDLTRKKQSLKKSIYTSIQAQKEQSEKPSSTIHSINESLLMGTTKINQYYIYKDFKSKHKPNLTPKKQSLKKSIYQSIQASKEQSEMPSSITHSINHSIRMGKMQTYPNRQIHLSVQVAKNQSEKLRFKKSIASKENNTSTDDIYSLRKFLIGRPIPNDYYDEDIERELEERRYSCWRFPLLRKFI